MTLTYHAQHIFIEFDHSDWGYRKGKVPGGAQSVVLAIKRDIGHISRNSDGFTYDPFSRQWTVADTPRNRKILEELKEFYLEPAQGQLFGK